MRDIGTAVGIRESSLYKHYSGKQAILDAIVEKAMELREVADLCSQMFLKQKKQ